MKKSLSLLLCFLANFLIGQKVTIDTNSPGNRNIGEVRRGGSYVRERAIIPVGSLPIIIDENLLLQSGDFLLLQDSDNLLLQ